MGQLFDFTCASCGYLAEISGGDDAGMLCETTTILCEDCKCLYDTVINKDSVIEEFHCPKGQQHTIRRWEYPDVCPKCGEEMKRGDFPIIMWD